MRQKERPKTDQIQISIKQNSNIKYFCIQGRVDEVDHENFELREELESKERYFTGKQNYMSWVVV
jgi:uncharacterized protein involved in tellurium resistance